MSILLGPMNGTRTIGRSFLFASIAFFLFGSTRANNIEVTGSSVQPADNGTAYVRFDISWENSWRDNDPPGNWDAAWIFAKYYDGDDGLWRHVHLASGGHSSPFGLIDVENGLEHPGQPFNVTNNKALGVFLLRGSNTTAPTTFNADDVRLVWDLVAEGITYGDVDSVKVFAIEMVMVPGGPFTLGSGGNELGHFYTYPDESSTYQVFSEAAIPVAPTAGSLYYPDTLGNPNFHWGDRLGPVPAAFPKGTQPFYIMKHEVSQRDFADFLNCLTRVQQANHTGTISGTLLAPGVTSVSNRYVMSFSSSVTSTRQVIRCDATIDDEDPVFFYCDQDGDNVGNEDGADGQWVACNYLHWLDLSAYLDWCGLRPMTELEFVKAARGTQAPVVEEYVWGNTTIAPSASITDPWLISETSGTSGANAVYSTSGPLRSGSFANAASDRTAAGAGYYGALDLAGNLGELAVTMGFPAGRIYDGTMGNGEIDAQGYADAPTWPANGYFNGAGVMGGHWATDNSYLRTSDRHTASHVTYTTRSAVNGGRGVRDAPVQ